MAENVAGRRDAAILVVLLLVALFSRLPFFFNAVINWDESTFILIGQEILDGRLPYVELWDLKPPLAFAGFAAAIAVFGQHIEGIRLAGALCVFAAGLAIWVAGRQLAGDSWAALLAIAAMIGIGSVSGGQATLTEHFAIVPACWALVVLSKWQRGYGAIVLAGLLLSVATLIRTNIAYLVLIVGLGFVLRPGGTRINEKLLELVAFGLGGALPVLVCVLPFWLSGNVDLLYRSVIAAPMAYATTQLSSWESLAKFVAYVIGPRQVLILCTLALGLAGVARSAWQLLRIRKVSPLEYWTLVFVIGSTISVAMSGAGHTHYMIQLVPLYAFGAIGIVTSALSLSPMRQWIAGGALGLGLAIALVPVGNVYINLTKRAMQGESLRTGRALSIAEYLETHNPDRKPVFLMEEHVAYWLTRTRPLTRMSTHPSNMTKAALIQAMEGSGATTVMEIVRVFDRAPEYVVRSPARTYEDNDPLLRAWLDEELKRHYQLVAQIEGLDIYRKRAKLSGP